MKYLNVIYILLVWITFFDKKAGQQKAAESEVESRQIKYSVKLELAQEKYENSPRSEYVASNSILWILFPSSKSKVWVFQVWHRVSTYFFRKIPQFHSTPKAPNSSPVASSWLPTCASLGSCIAMEWWDIDYGPLYKFNILLLAVPALYTNNTVLIVASRSRLIVFQQPNGSFFSYTYIA